MPCEGQPLCSLYVCVFIVCVDSGGQREANDPVQISSEEQGGRAIFSNEDEVHRVKEYRNYFSRKIYLYNSFTHFFRWIHTLDFSYIKRLARPHVLIVMYTCIFMVSTTYTSYA